MSNKNKRDLKNRRMVLTGVCGLASSALSGCLGSVLSPDEGEFGGPASGEPSLRWSATLGDEVRSPVVADSDMAFVSARDEHLYAVDVQSGERRWRVNVGLPGYPLIHEETVYTRSILTTVSAIDTQQGTVKWRIQNGGNYKYGPTAHDGRVYVAGVTAGASPDAAVIDPRTEAVSSVVDIPQAPVSPVLSAVDGVVVATAAAPELSDGQYTDGNVRRFDPELASEQWATQIGGRPRPTVDEQAGRVFVGGRISALQAISIADGSVVWRTPIQGVLGQPATDEAQVYVAVDDTVYAVSREGGRDRWEFRPEAPLFQSVGAMGTPVPTGEVVVVPDENGRLYAVDKADGSLRWTFKTDGDLRAWLTARKETLYVAARDTVYAIDL